MLPFVLLTLENVRLKYLLCDDTVLQAIIPYKKVSSAFS